MNRTVTYNATAADVTAVRRTLSALAKAHGVKVSVRKGKGSCAGTVHVQPGEYLNGSDAALEARHLAFRIAACQALAGTYDGALAPLAAHHLRLAVEHGHPALRVHLVPAASVVVS